MLKCAIVILNWNGIHFIKEFLPILIKNTSTNSEIIIVDNASTDGSVEFIKAEYPSIRLICLDKNYGFTGGYNQSLKQIEAKYYVLLNSDVEVTENWDIPLIDTLENNPKVGAVMPKMLSYYNHSEFEYAGAAGGFLDKYGYPFCRGRVYHTLEKDHGQYDGVHEIFWATGACMAVKANLYHQLGGLDDILFAHMEEIDFCWRLHNLGYSVLMNSQSVVFHLGGGTLPKYSPRKSYLNFRNNHIVLYKNLPPLLHAKIYISRIFLDTVSAFYFLAHFNISGFLIVFKAHLVFLLLLITGKIKRGKNIDSHPPLTKINTVSLYFLKKKKYYSELFS